MFIDWAVTWDRLSTLPLVGHTPLARWFKRSGSIVLAADLRTKILDFRGFDLSIILISEGGILMSIGNFPERSSRQILVGIILVGAFGVCALDSTGAQHTSQI